MLAHVQGANKGLKKQSQLATTMVRFLIVWLLSLLPMSCTLLGTAQVQAFNSNGIGHLGLRSSGLLPCRLIRHVTKLHSSRKPPLSKSDSRNKPGGRPTQRKEGAAVTRNKQIVALGKNRQWREMLSLYQKESAQYNNINYATTLTQLRKIRSVDKGDPSFNRFVDDLANAIEDKGLDWIGCRAIANIVHAIGTMSLQSKGALRIMEFVSQQEIAKAIVSNGTPQNVANVCWSMAKQGPSINYSLFLVEAEKRASWLIKEGTPQNVANTAWACATMGLQSPKLFAEIEKQSAWLIKEGTPQAVANTAWACATLGLQSPKLFAEIEKQSAWLVREGKPQEVVNTAWACAKMGLKSPNLIAEIETYSAWLVKEGTPQAVANTVWACATMGLQSPKLFAEIEKQPSWLIKEGKPQDVANAVWACATMGLQSPKLFAEIEKQSVWLTEEGTPQAVANTAWACATMGLHSPKLFAEIEKQSVWLIKEGDPQAVANTAWACATMGLHSPKLFAEIEKQSARLIKEGTPQAGASTALAFATLGYHSEAFFGSFCKIISELIKEGNEQRIINVCYAFAILDLTDKYEKEFRQLWAAAVSFDSKMATAEGSMQLFQAFAYSLARGMEISEPPFISGVEADTISSSSQKEVSSILRGLGFEHDEEVSPWNDGDLSAPPGMLVIDMACRKKMVAIEFDGPRHFLREAGPRKVLELENGATKAKRRFLERLGWKVINIPYLDWDMAKGMKEKKELLCRMLNITAKED